ncbi:response regulator [Stakelama pacifica]|uniref:Response regulator receiver domain-containing protein n=1 Tax=Stakelama pacifica TaxID=517720 RepID=A0A4R6FXP9_9SPHN|nr:response regulator [Stakelama pacifica]MAX01265.1 transcriptional regulator [Sphingomonas sp.]TDN86701.1 response regulator receiver domain-containing protein [Stakelama pacifica]GGO90418.1 response regulator [Stakelama pacifica]
MTEPHKILIVEDEPLIAMMLEDFLDMLGKQPAGSADTVAAALEQLSAGDFDAAILDVHLRGGEKAWPVAAALAERNIPFVLATGGSGEMIDPAFRDRPVLAKPFTMDGVEAALARLG